MGRERSLRDRNSQMSVPAKSFKDVLQIIEMAENEYRRREKQRKAQPPPQVLFLKIHDLKCCIQ